MTRVIPITLPEPPDGIWTKIWEWHKILLAFLLGVFIGAQAIGIDYNVNWLEWRVKTDGAPASVKVSHQGQDSYGAP